MLNVSFFDLGESVESLLKKCICRCDVGNYFFEGAEKREGRFCADSFS